MAAREKPCGGSQQRELFARSQDAIVNLDPNHRVVRMADEIDWTALLALVQRIRRQKLKNAAGRPPRLRALTGAVIFRSQRRIPYREAEDQIRHYAPARYLCGLTETSWSPDANTIQDFEQLLGEDGMRQINEFVVKWAVWEPPRRSRRAMGTLTLTGMTAFVSSRFSRPWWFLSSW